MKSNSRTAPSRRPGASAGNSNRNLSGTRATLPDGSSAKTTPSVKDKRVNNGRNQGRRQNPAAARKQRLARNTTDRDAASIRPKVEERLATTAAPAPKVTPGAVYMQPVAAKPRQQLITEPGGALGPQPNPTAVQPTRSINPAAPVSVAPGPVATPRQHFGGSPITGPVAIGPEPAPVPTGRQHFDGSPIAGPVAIGPEPAPTVAPVATPGVTTPVNPNAPVLLQTQPPAPGFIYGGQGVFTGSGGPRTIGNNVVGARFGFDKNAPSAIAGQNTRISIPGNPGVGILAAHKIAPATLRKMTPLQRQMFTSQIRASGQDPETYFAQAAYAEPGSTNTGRSFI